MMILSQGGSNKKGCEVSWLSLFFYLCIICNAFSLGIIFCSEVRAETYTGVININNGKKGADCTKGNGIRREEKREVAIFHEIDISGAFALNITCGQKQTIALSGDTNILPLVTTEVKNGVLTLHAPGALCMKQPVIITLANASIEKIVSSGANEINMRCDSLDSALTLLLNGSSELTFLGSLQSVTARLQGAAELDTRGGKIMQASIDAGGASKALVDVHDKLRAISSDASEIYYRDHPGLVVGKTSTEAGTVARLSRMD